MAGGIPLRRVVVSLAELVRSATEALRVQAVGYDVKLRVEVDELPEASVDADKIAWAVSALVGNALRHVRHGTRRMPGGAVSLAGRVDGRTGEVTIEISDDGPGIAPDQIDQLLVRQHGKTHAVGLTLLLVRDVVEAHGGRVDVRSNVVGPEIGTRVTIRLPAVDRTPPSAPTG
jgi:signal transduction histidine kinase